MRKAFLPLLTLAGLLAGCNPDDRPQTTFGGQVADQGREIRLLGEQWDEGARLMAKGQGLIDEGSRLAERGKEMIAEGQEKKRQSEAAYRALGVPPPGATPAQGS
ncbi:MAG: hypothetical protein KDG89_12975 [Geminicoccaceae bacterium]|nr:hypothetical protein [Geminicoccaceae bacterium]